MTRTIACILAIISALTASAQAQLSVPKPTLADAANVVKIISADKSKVVAYCKLVHLGDEIIVATDAGDDSKLERLDRQAGDLRKTLGAEFVQLDAGLDQVDFQSKDGKELAAELDKLDGLCPEKL